jgi:hypothetical protein
VSGSLTANFCGFFGLALGVFYGRVNINVILVPIILFLEYLFIDLIFFLENSSAATSFGMFKENV